MMMCATVVQTLTLLITYSSVGIICWRLLYDHKLLTSYYGKCIDSLPWLL